jgi:hypothetical protein
MGKLNMKMYAKVVAVVIMATIMGMMVREADGHLQQQQQKQKERLDGSVVMPPGHSSSLYSSHGSPSSHLQRQAQETSSTMEPSTSAAVMMDPPVDGQDDADAVDADADAEPDADAEAVDGADAVDADAVMMDPPVTNETDADADAETDSMEWEDSASQGPPTSGTVDVVVPVQDNYDYTNYQDFLNGQWPAMTETCARKKHKFNSLTQKRVYRLGVQATSGVERAWQDYNTTFVTYLNAVVGPRFDPPIRFEMAVTESPLKDWVSSDKTDEQT